MRLGYQANPVLLIGSFSLMVASWIPMALGALWLKLLINGVADHDNGRIRLATMGIAGAAAGGWLLGVIGSRLQSRFRDRVTIELEAHVARLQATVSTLEHHERPDYLNRLQLLRNMVFLLDHLYLALFGTIGTAGQLLVTVGLLMSIHPALALLLLAAIPPVWVSTWRASVERRTEEDAQPHMRLARHLFDLGTAAGPGKEVRTTGTQNRLVGQRQAAWSRWYAEVGAARWSSAGWYALAWIVFGLGYVAAVVFVASGLDRPPGDVLLALAAGANLSRFLASTVGQVDFLRWALDASQRLVWLEDYAAAHAVHEDAPVPAALSDGIHLDDVTFAYPGTDRNVLEHVSLDLKAGSVVALVGENGAGKTTLVKLLCRFYDPTQGRITVDGTDLRAFPPDGWRSRLSGAFQDFFQFEYLAGRTVGVGDVARADDLVAVGTAVERGGAASVVEQLPKGLGTQLGPTWNDGVELSIGQWQKLALARGLMRDEPLLAVLDEPTAALDAETEHDLFERFAAQARSASADGRITVLVSHRFSTVRMADLIVVLDGNRIAESGSHDDLVAKGGLYAELYEMQAQAYR
ncbi:MAG: ABC transporter ATP-binding protein [Acidobacteria bacterium]|nr:ABC transporter ATP-binding protein [Acidobacteriota bacterium]